MIERTKLSNGLTILYQWTPQDPIAACHLFIPNGALLDPSGKAGLTTLHWALFTKGTEKRKARKFAEDVELMGASMGAGSTYDYSEISCHAPADQMEAALAATAECLFLPAFNENEINKEKTALQAAIRSKKESIFTITHEIMTAHLYPNHPYGRPSSGDEKTVQTLTREDLLARHKNLMNPSGAILAMASNIPFKTIMVHLESLFGSNAWKESSLPKETIPSPAHPEAGVELKSSSQFEQAYLMLGFPAAGVLSADYVTLKVLNGILGGGMSTRLFQSLREKQGLAYDVGSFYATKKLGSAFVVHMGLQAARINEAKHGIFKELELMQKEKVPEAELQLVKNQLKGGFILDHQTNSQRAHYIGWWEILGLGSDFDQTYPSKIDSVTSESIHKAANQCFQGPSIFVQTVPQSRQPEPESAARA